MKIGTLIVSGIVSFTLIVACKTADQSRKSQPAGGSVLVETAAQNGQVVTAVYGANTPDSYTFLDTPDANICLDAFIRQGKELPVNTVARTLDASSYRANGIVIMDYETTLVPVLNVIHMSAAYSDVMIQLLNKNGFYCIVNNDATFSNVTIQRSCTAQIAEIEPISHVTTGGGLNLCGFRWPWQAPIAQAPATTRGFASIMSETPCIP